MRTQSLSPSVQQSSIRLLSISLVCLAALTFWVSGLVPTPSVLAGGEEEPPVPDMKALFDYDGLLDFIIQRLFEDGRPVINRMPPFELPPSGGGDGSGPDPDGIPYANVFRVTVDGPMFKGFYAEGLGRNPEFCSTPLAPPLRKESRITLEIWTPDPLNFADLASAVVLVQKSIAPSNDGVATPPQLMADQLVQWGVCSVIWWERDDAPAVDTLANLDLLVAARNDDQYQFFLGTGARPEPPLTQPLPEGTFPHDIVGADFNGDGELDIAVVNDGVDTMRVRLGDGYGLFTDETILTTGAFPRAVETAQLNPDIDGTEDIVVANRNSDDITLFFGDGDGNFSTTTTISVGAQPSAIVIADFDEDLHDDIAVANGDDDTITILFGDGAGNFGLPNTVATGDNPFSIGAGDFDGDTHLDLVTANRDGNDSSLLLGNGDGTFQSAATHPAGLEPSELVVGFLDGDGDLDMAIANGGSDDVTVLIGDGTGGFAAPATFAAGDFPNAMQLGDFDGDTNLDLIVANRDSADLTALLGNGAGAFAEFAGSPFRCGDGPSGLWAANVTDSTLKLAHQFGYTGDGTLQQAGFGWMVHRRLNKGPAQSLTAEELRFDFRFAYAQAYLIATTFFQEFLKFQFSGNPNVDAWVDALQISYAGGSKRGGGVATAVMQSNILSTVDPRNVVGLFISGYEGLDAGELSGFHRYESDWGHTFDPTEIETFRAEPCPVPPCEPEPCPSSGCAEDSGEHVFKEFAIWAHRMRSEPQSYAQAYTPSENATNLALLSDKLIIDAVGTHDWINPLGSHADFWNANPSLDRITLQRINRNHGSLVEMGEFSATDILQMRAKYNMRWAADQPMINALPLNRIRWVSLDDSSPNWVATIELETTSTVALNEDYTVWVAMSDDRDFRRNSDPIESRPNTPCIDSDPNLMSDDEDQFFEVTPISVVNNGDERVITFAPPPAINSFSNPLVAVIVEGFYDGGDPTETVDDLLVTTLPEFLNEDSYKSGISACQGKDGENVLSVNGNNGVAQDHTVLVDSTGPILFRIVKPSTGGSGKFLALLDAGSPTESTITKLTNTLGYTCFPMLLTDGASPVARWNTVGKEEKVGSTEYFGTPLPDPARAPVNFLTLPSGDASNLPIGTVFTLHAVILNPAIVVGKPASITNSIVVTVF